VLVLGACRGVSEGGRFDDRRRGGRIDHPVRAVQVSER
jgi:hypothetical protein